MHTIVLAWQQLYYDNLDTSYSCMYNTGIVQGILTDITFIHCSLPWLLLQAAHGDTCTALQQPLNNHYGTRQIQKEKSSNIRRERKEEKVVRIHFNQNMFQLSMLQILYCSSYLLHVSFFISHDNYFNSEFLFSRMSFALLTE